jgi:hypothetical protein
MRRPVSIPQHYHAQIPSVCQGPDVEVLTQKRLTGWQASHGQQCACARCIRVIPADTAVRVIPPRICGLDRTASPIGSCSKSESPHGTDMAQRLLEIRWSHNQKRFTLCRLHCLMKITEGMFQGVTKRCLKMPHVIDRLNADRA